MLPEELERLMKKEWDESMCSMDDNEVMWLRRHRVQDLDGVEMPPFSGWPKSVRNMIRSGFPYIEPRNTSMMFLFFVGNGLCPSRAGSWVLTNFALYRQTNREQIAALGILDIAQRYRELIYDGGGKLTYYNVISKKWCLIRTCKYLKHLDDREESTDNGTEDEEITSSSDTDTDNE